MGVFKGLLEEMASKIRGQEKEHKPTSERGTGERENSRSMVPMKKALQMKRSPGPA